MMDKLAGAYVGRVSALLCREGMVGSMPTCSTKVFYMGIGIGLHCWHCEHGPCTGECKGDERERDAKKKGFNDGISRAQLAIVQEVGLTHEQKTKLWDELEKLRWM